MFLIIILWQAYISRRRLTIIFILSAVTICVRGKRVVPSMASLESCLSRCHTSTISGTLQGEQTTRIVHWKLNLIRSHNFLVPLQCMGSLGCFPQNKQAAIVCHYLAPPPPSPPPPPPPPIPPFPYHRLSGLFLLQQMDFNICKNVGVCHTLTRRDRKTVLHLAPPGDQTQGLRIWIPTLTTELHPPPPTNICRVSFHSKEMK